MPIGRPIAPVSLSDQERTSLQNWARRPKSAQALHPLPYGSIPNGSVEGFNW